MNIQNLIDSANGELSAGVLQKTRDGLSEEEFEEWSSGVTPVEYLRDDEQPHYLWAQSGNVVKVTSDHSTKLIDRCRVPLSSVNKWKNKHGKGKVGYIGSEQFYPNITLITDQRFVIFVGKEPEDEILEFNFEETQVTIDLVESSILADDIQYQINPLEADTSKFHFVLEESNFTRAPVSMETGISNAGSTNTESSSSDLTLTQNVSSSYFDGKPSLSKIKSLSPRDFEHLVAEVWRSMGYSCTVTSKGRDSGIDVIAKKDDEQVLIQAKRYTDKNVGVDTVQRVAGLLVDKQFDPSKVAIVTTSEYTNDAIDRANQIDSLSIINGFELVSRFE